MKTRTLLSGLIGGSLGTAVVLARRRSSSSSTASVSVGAVLGAAAGVAAQTIASLPGKVAMLESLMPNTQVTSSYSQVVKPTPPLLFTDRGSGTDFETRLSSLDGYLTPSDRFYIRSHSPTPEINVHDWRLKVNGTGVRSSIALTCDEIAHMTQVTLTRTIECAGNGRRFFKETFGVEGEGGQWRTGAIGCAEWTGVRLRDVLERAGLTDQARDVMPEGLDDHQVSRPMPLKKALKEDTLLVLKMNGETLPPDHGYPVRVLVSGWTGTASIKWVGRIQVAEEPLYSPYNTMEYVMVGPKYAMQFPALGPPITEMPVTSMLDLDWPAKLRQDAASVIRGRAFAGEGKIREVAYSLNKGPWRQAEVLSPVIEGAWVRWQFEWNPTPGQHEIRVRATDEKGRIQPDSVPWNHNGYVYNAVVAHPVTVS